MTGSRALLRVARRDAQRHRVRSLLVVLMIAVPVAAMGTTITTIRTATLTPEQDVADEIGQADLIVSTPFQPRDWQALLPEGSRAVPYRGSENALVVHDGEIFNASVLETDLSEPVFRGDRELVAGRAARGPSEVVVSRELRDQLAVRVGDRIQLREPKRTVSVTGVAVAPNSLDWSFLVAGAGWRNIPGDPFPLDATWRVDLPPGADTATVASVLERHFLPALGGTNDGVTTRQEILGYSKVPTGKRAAELSLTYLAGALLLIWTGSVAAAAFAVGARRRLREVGLVAANGGSPRQLRALLLADGVVLGLAGAVAGVGLGVAIASVLSHHLDRFTNHVNGPLRVPVGGLVGAAAVGLVAATVAALIPAVGAARVPVVSALAGLRPARPRTRSWLAVGAVAMIAGVALCTYGGGRGEDKAALAGVVLVVGGVAMATGGLLGLVARLSSRLPLPIRFAARDANRVRTRSAPAIAAAMLGLAATVGATTVALSGEAKERYGYEPYLRDDQILVDLSQGPVPGPVVSDAPAIRRAVAGALPEAQVGALGQAAPPGAGEGLRVASAGLPHRGESLYIGDRGTLAALGARRAEPAFDAGRVLALGEGSAKAGRVRLVAYNDSAPKAWGELAATDVDVAVAGGLPSYLISEEAARVLGLRAENPQLIVRLPRPATDRHERRVLAAVLDASDTAIPAVSRNYGLPDRAAAVGLALGAGAALALFVVGLVTALARSELRPFLGTLAAVGAAPRARRAVSAAQSGVMAAVAALLAVPAGLIPAIALVRTQAGPYVRYPTEFLQTPETIRHPVAIPWLVIAAVVFAVPLVAALGGGLLTRTRTAAGR